MTLYDMLAHTLYCQRVVICEGNVYDENIVVFRGTVDHARTDENVFERLMDEIDHYEFAYGTLIIITKSEFYEKRAETRYPEMYVKKWSMTDPKTRPWRTMLEIKAEIENDYTSGQLDGGEQP